jgi:pantothenate kinase
MFSLRETHNINQMIKLIKSITKLIVAYCKNVFGQ